MENRAHAFLAGFFTLTLGAIIIVSLLWFSASGRRENRELVVVSRQNVSGLSLQARVSYRGIPVGRVMDIRLNPDDRREILIYMRVDKDLPLSEGVSARLTYQGVTGIAQVLLEDDETHNRPLPETISGELPRIPLQAGLMTQLQDSLPEMLGEVRSFIKNANSLLDPENRRHLAGTLARLDSATARADDTLGSLKEMLSAENVQSASKAMRNMPDLVEEARQMAQRVDSVAARLNDGLGQKSNPDEGLMPQIVRTSRELTVASRQLGRLLEMLERSPQSLIFGAPPIRPGPGETGFVTPEHP